MLNVLGSVKTCDGSLCLHHAEPYHVENVKREGTIHSRYLVWLKLYLDWSHSLKQPICQAFKVHIVVLPFDLREHDLGKATQFLLRRPYPERLICQQHDANQLPRYRRLESSQTTTATCHQQHWTASNSSLNHCCSHTLSDLCWICPVEQAYWMHDTKTR